MRASTVAAAAILASAVQAGSLADIEHVVLFMQENRAFDHYFGSMSGVRGFSDPNAKTYSDGSTVFQQTVPPSFSKKADVLNPWPIAYQGGNWTEATQCAIGGDNSWQSNHAALNHDINNHWVRNNTPYSWSYFTRSEIPVHFSIAEAWTVGDMYQESVIAATNPNRVTWMSNSINCPGGPQRPDQGGMLIDNTGTPGCEGPHLNCYPLNWTTFPEYLQDAGVTWQVYQDVDNFGDDPLVAFSQYQNAPKNSPLTKFGNSYPGLSKFYSDAKAGTLPRVSYIVGPMELSEHPPYQPKDGAWLQEQVVKAVVDGASYNNTALIISFDETGGWGDHVVPFHSSNGTAGEWVQDPYGDAGYTYTGPGFRLPLTIISPWTRGGHVFTEHADHNSQTMFLEQWLATKGYKNVQTPQMPAWRRAHMSNLVSAFDFDHPDHSIPKLVPAETPSKNAKGKWDGAARCEAKYGNPMPKVPYGPENAKLDPASLSEEGFKGVRGYLTEGRYLVFEMNGYALANGGGSNSTIQTSNSTSGQLSATKATADHNAKQQRWVLHAKGGSATNGGSGSGSFTISNAVDGRYLTSSLGLTGTASKAATFSLANLGNGAGYSIAGPGGSYLEIGTDGKVSKGSSAAGFQTWSVTYHS